MCIINKVSRRLGSTNTTSPHNACGPITSGSSPTGEWNDGPHRSATRGLPSSISWRASRGCVSSIAGAIGIGRRSRARAGSTYRSGGRRRTAGRRRARRSVIAGRRNATMVPGRLPRQRQSTRAVSFAPGNFTKPWAPCQCERERTPRTLRARRPNEMRTSGCSWPRHGRGRRRSTCRSPASW